MLQEQIVYSLVEYSSSEILNVITFNDYTLAKASMAEKAYHALIKSQETDNYSFIENDETTYKIFYKDGEWLQYKVIPNNVYGF
jgi:hypothetical protein